MADFLRCLAAVWCFEIGGLFTWVAVDVEYGEQDGWPRLFLGWFIGSVFMALGWWLA